MKHFYIEEDGALTVVQAHTALQATEHYAQHHGWRLPQDTLRLVKVGHWQLFGGEIQVFDQAPAGTPGLTPPIPGVRHEQP